MKYIENLIDVQLEMLPFIDMSMIKYEEPRFSMRNCQKTQQAAPNKSQNKSKHFLRSFLNSCLTQTVVSPRIVFGHISAGLQPIKLRICMQIGTHWIYLLADYGVIWA